jgi:hypothetical protein
MTIKVKPWGKDQGDYVLIEAENFDPSTHEKVEDDKPKRGRPSIKEADEK